MIIAKEKWKENWLLSGRACKQWWKMDKNTILFVCLLFVRLNTVCFQLKIVKNSTNYFIYLFKCSIDCTKNYEKDFQTVSDLNRPLLLYGNFSTPFTFLTIFTFYNKCGIKNIYERFAFSNLTSSRLLMLQFNSSTNIGKYFKHFSQSTTINSNSINRLPIRVYIYYTEYTVSALKIYNCYDFCHISIMCEEIHSL